MNRLYSIKQIARGGEFETIPLSPPTLYQLVEKGKLPIVRIGKRIMVSTKGLEDFLRRIEEEPDEADT